MLTITLLILPPMLGTGSSKPSRHCDPISQSSVAFSSRMHPSSSASNSSEAPMENSTSRHSTTFTTLPGKFRPPLPTEDKAMFLPLTTLLPPNTVPIFFAVFRLAWFLEERPQPCWSRRSPRSTALSFSPSSRTCWVFGSQARTRSARTTGPSSLIRSHPLSAAVLFPDCSCNTICSSAFLTQRTRERDGRRRHESLCNVTMQGIHAI